MNRFIAVFGLIAVVSFQTFCFAGLDDKRYTIKSGIAEYEISGHQQGKETLYFDDFGRLEARHTNTSISILGITQTTEQIQYIDHEWMYSFDPKTNIAIKSNWKEMAEAMRKNSSAQTLREFGEDMLKSWGGQKTGSKTMLGKSCDVWKIPQFSTEACIYKNSVPLETRAQIAGIEIHSIATSFEENAKIPTDKIQISKTAKIEERSLADYAMPADSHIQPEQMPNLNDIMRQVTDAQNEAQDEIDMQNLSDKEITLKEKELMLREKELELKAQEMAQKNQKTSPNKNTLDKMNQAVSTTNNVKNTFNGLKSIFGR